MTEKPIINSLGDHTLILGNRGEEMVMWARLQRQKLAGRDVAACEVDSEYLHRAAGLMHPRLAEPLVQGIWCSPLRAPHFSCSMAGLTGSIQKGWKLRPGELSLAHGGIFLLDDATEWRHDAIALVKMVARKGSVALWCGSANGLLPEQGSMTIVVPARFRLIATAQLCPCGRYGNRECKCPAAMIELYQRHVKQLADFCRVVPAEEWQAEVKAARAQDSEVVW